MSLRTKIVISVLSFVSMIFSLIEPSKRIFLSLIPIMLAAYYWVYEDKKTNSIKYKWMKNTAFILLTSCLIALLVLSFTSTVEPLSSNTNTYAICFYQYIVGIGGMHCDYLPVAIAIIIFYSFLAIFDVINYYLSNKIVKKVDNRTFAQRVA